MRTTIASFALALLILSPAARAGGLSIGDPAPALTVSKWVKGEKVDKLEKGQLYVVEFWATWCGPCRTSIPHLTELQKKNPKVTFIGVSILESDQKEVEPFVKEMGDKMDYRVAMDDVAEQARGGNDGRDGTDDWFEGCRLRRASRPRSSSTRKARSPGSGTHPKWTGRSPRSSTAPTTSRPPSASVPKKAAESVTEDLGRKVGPNQKIGATEELRQVEPSHLVDVAVRCRRR